MLRKFFSENRAVNELIRKKSSGAGQATDDNIIRRMHFACWITEATHARTQNT